MSHHSSITLSKKSSSAMEIPEGLQYEQIATIIEKLRIMITVQGVDLPHKLRDPKFIQEQIMENFGDEARFLKLLLSNDFGQGYLFGLIVAYNSEEIQDEYEER